MKWKDLIKFIEDNELQEFEIKATRLEYKEWDNFSTLETFNLETNDIWHSDNIATLSLGL